MTSSSCLSGLVVAVYLSLGKQPPYGHAGWCEADTD